MLNLRRAALFLCPIFLLASCVLSRLKVDDSAGGGASNGGNASGNAGRSSGAAGQPSGSAGKSSGGANSEGGGPDNAGAPNNDAGSPDQGGAGASPGAGAGGAGNTAGAPPGAGAGGAPAGGAGAGGAPAGGAPAGGSGGTMNSAGAPAGGAAGAPPNPLLTVVKTSGCGKDPMLPGGLVPTPGTALKATIQTSGTKPANCADSVCGAWSYARDYYVTLPASYDKNRAYELVFQGGGCGGNGLGVYTLTQTTANANDTVIRVGLTPPPNAIGHATNPNQGCFDDKDGNNSVDFTLYENLRDQLKTELCYDENRVFASGDSSGSFLANELGCRYAGSPQFGTGGLRSQYALRGIITNTGGLPTAPPYGPTCNTQPMAGMWITEINDPENPILNIKAAVNRAMTVNGCSGNNVDTATQVSYPIGGGNVDGTCKLIQGCPAIYPLVTCFIMGNTHNSHLTIANPGFSTFLEQFTSAPFVN